MSRKEKELTEEEFFTQRQSQLQAAAQEGLELYPHKFDVKSTFAEMRKLASIFQNEETGDEPVQSAGRVMSIRGHGKLFFFSAESDSVDLQLVLNSGSEELYRLAALLKRGDIVGFSGVCGRTRTGEPSVFIRELKLLSPCFHVIPSCKNTFSNPESIYRRRYLDLLVNRESRQRFLDRTRIIQYIRNYLVENHYVEVETPMMSHIHGGAAAKPFKTHHNELKQDLYLRVAPELFLKKLVIGGLNRVFELGKQFRNEGIDLTHNPEFTSVEFYQAYADYRDIMVHVEKLLSGLVTVLKGSLKFVYQIDKREEGKTEVELDFSAPFARIDILTELSRVLGLKLDGKNISEPETLRRLLKAADEKGLKVEAPLTLNRVLDAFVGEFIEPQCINPTFVTGFPVVTSPLAKDDRDRPGLTERFELFVNGKELANAYTELNIPEVQRRRFTMQSADASAGDEEAMPPDEEFCKALEYALPPTGGCGIGIDRLVMYLTNAANIRDVLFFPAMRPENQ